MTTINNILFFLLSSFLFIPLTNAQEFSDKDFFLVDSIILDELPSTEVKLLDSCLKKYHALKQDTDKVKIISFLIDESFSHKVWPKYNQWLIEFIESKSQLQNDSETSLFFKKTTAALIGNQGYYYSESGDVDKAIPIFIKSIELAEELNNEKGLATHYNNLGIAYEYKGDLLKALDYFNKSLILFEKTKNHMQIAALLINIASIHAEQRDSSTVLSLIEQSREIFEKIDHKKGIAVCLSYEADLYQARGNYIIEREKRIKSFNIYSSIGDEKGVALTYSQLGIIEKELGNITRAQHYFRDALNVYKKINDKGGEASELNNIGTIKFLQKKYNEAKEYATKSMQYSKDLGHVFRIRNAANLLYKVNRAQKNYKASLSNYELYIKLRDSLKSEKIAEKAINQRYQFEYQTKKIEDSLKNQEAQLIKDATIATQKLRIKQEETQRYSLYAGLTLITLFAFFMLHRFRLSNKQKRLILEQKQAVELAHKQLEEKSAEISDSIKYAQRLQNAILPPISNIPTVYKASFIFLQPKSIVSGDFYWFLEYNDISFIAAADSTGHGIPGALVSVVCSNALYRCVNEFKLTQPAEILEKSRSLIVETFSKKGENVKDGMDISLIAVKDNQLFFSGANNPLWIIRKTDKVEAPEHTTNYKNLSLIELKGNRQSVGLSIKMSVFQQQQFKLLPGDCLYLFTDGFADQFGGKHGKKLMYKPFKRFLLEIADQPIVIQEREVKRKFRDWKGNNDQIDDVCVIGIRV